METFEKVIRVQKDDLDELDHVNNVRYVQWIQDISKDHWRSKAPKELLDNVVWVVVSHHIKYKSAAKLGDSIHIKTYIEKTEGATSVRVVEMHQDGTDKLLVRSKTEWCLLNSQNLKPMRISTEIKDVFA